MNRADTLHNEHFRCGSVDNFDPATRVHRCRLLLAARLLADRGHRRSRRRQSDGWRSRPGCSRDGRRFANERQFTDSRRSARLFWSQGVRERAEPVRCQLHDRSRRVRVELPRRTKRRSMPTGLPIGASGMHEWLRHELLIVCGFSALRTERMPLVISLVDRSQS